jgi:hypothetical protein
MNDRGRMADILLVSQSPVDSEPGEARSSPPVQREIEVGPGISLCGIEPGLARAVMDRTRIRMGCVDSRDRDCVYGLVRFDPPGWDWDEDYELSRVVFLSHLVRATDMGFEFSARVVLDASDRLIDVRPSSTSPTFARALYPLSATRRWLTQGEGEVLRDLVAAYKTALASPFPARLGTAIATFRESPFVFHGRARLMVLASTLECLVSTSEERAKKQFVTRTAALACEVGLPDLDEAWAEHMYELRSRVAHGNTLYERVADASGQEIPERAKRRDLVNEEFQRAIASMDELLRRLIRQGLLDLAFRQRLEDLDSLWPVPPARCPTCRGADGGAIAISCRKCSRRWDAPDPEKPSPRASKALASRGARRRLRTAACRLYWKAPPVPIIGETATLSSLM